jgi:hypothetical protein
MGVDFVVAALADLLEHDEEGAEGLREDLADVNRVLVANGLPPHEEPERLVVESRAGVSGVPCEFLHTLRRAFAHALLEPGRPLTPLRKNESPTRDLLIRRASTRASHLLYHSDNDGFYVPLDFELVIEDESLTGRKLGSSQRLFAELIPVARLLGIRLEGERLSDDEAKQIRADPNDAPLFRERLVWLMMFEAARLSVAHRTAIAFL